ncbi:MAG TPA: amylo-alpha-1,6-glucosidase [Verrucomicrobiae bacterium]|nr:amylo-alpha-1,6-glucosidase [Verrucomicrobiae bacterium]
MSLRVDQRAEWLEADGRGGFASGTASGIRTRRYHALLLAATTPPSGRFVLVNGLEAWIETARGTRALSSQAYSPDIVHPDGARHIDSFETEPWPAWEYVVEGGLRVRHEIFVPRGRSAVVMSWKLAGKTKGVTLKVRPLLSGRDPHATHHQNGGFQFADETRGATTTWRPYPGVPSITALTNGAYAAAPDWYGNFLYEEERARGLDFTEDLASPGVFTFDLSKGEAVMILSADAATPESGSATAVVKKLRAEEKRRRGLFATPLHRAADAYLVTRGSGKTIIAGYPWFGDWGRDTFIALRGLCLATGRLDDARDILVEWAGAVSEGMLPNRFTDRGEIPEYNSVDASLWYVIAVHDLTKAVEEKGGRLATSDLKLLHDAVDAILTGYSAGTRFGIRMDRDGLLLAGAPGVQLTWMDAKVGAWVVTPRAGKPVEIQALWLNALLIASGWNAKWQPIYARGLESFRARFWNDAGGYLHDVVDVNGAAGTFDTSFRPNQIFAVGGLPVALFEGERAKRVVEGVTTRLLTPMGLRSLAPGERGYAARYEGGVLERDGAYHQGTVWPWLIGPFVEAWVRVRGDSAAARTEARERFLDPLLAHLETAGLGHIAEIADAEAPFTPRGCPFQAWSVGEVLRLDALVLAERAVKPKAKRKTAAPARATR